MSFKKIFALIALLITSGTQAITTVEFITPDGNVGANDTIEVWLRISTDTGFTFDADDPDGDMSYGGAIDPLDVPTGGFSPDANMGAGGFIEFDFIDTVYGTIGASCGGSFVINSDGDCTLGGGATGEYSFTFGGAAGQWAPGGFADIPAGGSIDILFGTFTPVAGGAAPGTYNFYRASILIAFGGIGFDDFGEEQFATAIATVTATCAIDDMSCDFSRTVVVPVPAAMWLMLSGLLGLFGISARRQSS